MTASLVGFSVRRPILVLMIVAAIAALSIWHVASAFDFRTDMDSLMSGNLGWRKDADRVTSAFPSEGEDIVVVIDGDTPELTERAANTLADVLAFRSELFAAVERVNGGPFFDREGMLLQPLDDVRAFSDALVAAQPIIGPTAADPSLRGLASALQQAIVAAPSEGAEATRLAKLADGITTALSRPANQPSNEFSWRAVLLDQGDDPKAWRQFIQILPRGGGDTASNRQDILVIREAIRTLNLEATQGLHVRLTGSIPIAEEELAALKETTGPIAGLMMVLLVGILFAALRSVRLVLAVCVTVSAGAIATLALGLLAVGQFNLISIAFLPLFVGLGMDFTVQYAVRFRHEAGRSNISADAQLASALAVGGALACAAAATTIGFLAFLPTAYRGVAELGLVAGMGMPIMFLLTITLLPALIAILGVDRGAAPIRRDAHEAWARRAWPHYAFLAFAALLTIAAALELTHMKFDFDPMHLRNPELESMSTYLELSQSTETTPNTLDVLASASKVTSLVARLRANPEIGRVTSLQSLNPELEDAKLARLSETRELLDFSLKPFEVAPPPSDSDVRVALLTSAEAMRSGLGERQDRIAASGRRLAAQLASLASGSATERALAATRLCGGLVEAFDLINAALSPVPLSLETLPAGLRRQWLSPEGLWRIEVAPSHVLGDIAATERFVRAVRDIAPKASGDAVTIVESRRAILQAFAIAGGVSVACIALLLLTVFGQVRWIGLTVFPVIMSGVLSLGTCALIGLPINLENMIALPLLLGIGIAFNIYFVSAWKSGSRRLLRSNLVHGVVFSALTTGTSFGALALSAHPGTASLGELLGISLAWILVCTLVVTPALLSLFAARGPVVASEAFVSPH